MDPIQAAIEAINLRELGEHFTYKEYAEKFNVDRSTLSRRHRGQTGSMGVKKINQQKLSPQQELELVRCIEDLTKRGLPPTREMIRNISSEIAHSESWVTRHSLHLISKRATGLDRTRVLAKFEVKYRLYFELLHGKMEEYDIEPGNSYNMDEKGFLMGLIGRSKRIFPGVNGIRK
jgi:AraC-like DNA-binding protein